MKLRFFPLVLSVVLPWFWVQESRGAKPSSGPSGITRVEIKVIPNLVKFDTTQFDVAAGATVELVFSNGCVMPHNLVVIRAAAESAVIAGVNALGLEGMDKGFVPDVTGIVAATKLLQPKQSQTLTFKAPQEAGEYPYVCTFPGHWFTMRGMMRVRASGEKTEAAVRSGEKVVNVPDALKLSGVTHKPQGTMAKPLVMRSFAPDPGLDPAVFAHHGKASVAVKYDPETRRDITQRETNPLTGQAEERPVLIKAEPGIAGAIAVNHGAEFSYVWDSTECRLMYAWRGGFLDMNPYWGKEPGSGRAKNYIPWVIGALVYRASGSAPLLGDSKEAPQFGGYRMVEGVPEFWYRREGRVVRERVVPKAAEGFSVEVTVEGAPIPGGWKVGAKDAGFVSVEEAGGGRFRVDYRDRLEPPMPAYQPAQEKKKNP
ncbi:MAG: hypothetical protein RLZZ142_2342 [Verrucomicrobiota bacterium]|jgi:azurin